MSRPRRPRRAARAIATLVALGLMTVGHGALAETRTLDVNKHPMLRNLPGPAVNAPPAFGLGGILPGLGNGIRYHGGPIMLGTTHAYAIWYGSWSDTRTDFATTPGLVQQFLKDDGGSPYFNINTTYTNASGARVTNAVTFAGSTMVGPYKGTTLSDANVQEIVADAITSGKLPTVQGLNVPDPNGVYFVLTSKEIGESSGFLTSYCGWHSNGTVAGVDTKFSFVGDASKNLSVCAGQTAASPNNNPAGDAMVNVMAHELEEAVTDPDLNAWYDFTGKENADKCAWKFGTTTTMPNGAKYNMTINTRRYLIQQNWLNANGGLCTLSY